MPEGDLVTPAHTLINLGNLVGFAARAVNGRCPERLQFADRLGVVGVMMGDEDMVEAPVAFGELRADRAFLRCVDRRRQAGRRIVQEHAEIVLETREQMNLCRHLSRPP